MYLGTRYHVMSCPPLHLLLNLSSKISSTLTFAIHSSIRLIRSLSQPFKFCKNSRTLGKNPVTNTRACIANRSNKTSQNETTLVFPSTFGHPLRPDVFLVYTATPHALHSLLGLFLGYTSFLFNDLRYCLVDFACHVCGVTADVEVCFFLEEVVDELGVLGEHVLDVTLFLGVFTGEGVEDCQFVAEGGFVCLRERC